MQNSAVNSFPWVNPANFTSNTSNSSKSNWQDYQNLNLAADLFLKKNHQNIYSPSTISQLAAHSNYLEKMSNLTATVNSNNDMQSLSAASNQLQSQSQLPDLNEKCPHHHSKDRLKYSCEICIQEYSLNLNSKDSLKNMQCNSNLNHFSHQLSTPNSGHLAMLSNSAASGLQSSNSLSKSTMDNLQLQNSSSSSFSNQNGQNGNVTPVSSGSGSGRKCLNKGNFHCVVCNKSFTQKGNLKTHQLIHTGQKPFTCNVCGKAFTQKGNVDTHMKIHTGQKKARKNKQKDDSSFNKDRFIKNDFKMTQRNKSDLNNSTNLISSSNQQEALLNMNQNQSVMDRLLQPMHSSLINESIKSNHHQLNNGHSPINFSNTSSTQNWSNLTNNLINNSSTNHHNNKSFDNFANLAGYNSFTQQQMSALLLNQNGKHSPIQNLSMQQQQQIDLNQISNNYNGVDFPLLQ